MNRVTIWAWLVLKSDLPPDMLEDWLIGGDHPLVWVVLDSWGKNFKEKQDGTEEHESSERRV